MAVSVSCTCGATYALKDELAGKSMRCPKCGAVIKVGGGAGAEDAPIQPGLDPVFQRSKFLLRQKALTIGEKYFVWDERGDTLLFIERPAHLLRGLLAAFAALTAAGVVGAALGFATSKLPESIMPFGIILTVFAVIASVILVAIPLSAKRHITFYRDETKSMVMLKILQDQKFAFLRATYSVQDAAGQPLALLTKNYIYNIFRKRWYINSPDGHVMAMALEDSLLLSLLRRLLGTFFGLLRTNFIIVRGESEDVIGEFNRKFTLLDRYVLDMSADSSGQLDRRIALAIGVMLDTGERR